MADQTNTEQKIETVTDAVTAPVKAVAAKVEAAAKRAPKSTAKRAPKRTAKTAAKVKTAVRARRAGKVNAKVAKTVAKTSQRAASTARRLTNAAATGAVTQIERTSKMTNDFTQLFAGFQIPGSDKFQGLFADAGARGQELVGKSQNATQEITDLAKANVEALTEAGRIAANGVKSIGQDVLASSRDGLEQASNAVRSLTEAKSPTEFFQLQSDLMRSSFDRIVSQSSKLTEQMVKLAGEAIQPISNRASVNAERVNELMA